MTVQRLILRHEIDLGEMRNPQFFVTDDSRLLVRGTCMHCGLEVNCFLPLAEFQGTDSAEEAPDRPQAEFTARDVQELRAMRIALPPEK